MGLKEGPYDHSDFIFSDPTYPRQNGQNGHDFWFLISQTTIWESAVSLIRITRAKINTEPTNQKACGQEVLVWSMRYALTRPPPRNLSCLCKKKKRKSRKPCRLHFYKTHTPPGNPRKDLSSRVWILIGNTWTGGCLLPHHYITSNYPTKALPNKQHKGQRRSHLHC